MSLSALLLGCSNLPSLEGRSQTYAYTKEQVADTYFAKHWHPWKRSMVQDEVVFFR